MIANSRATTADSEYCDDDGDNQITILKTEAVKIPKRKIANEIIEIVEVIPVISNWKGSKGSTGDDRFVDRLKNAELALKAGKLTKEQKIRKKFERLKTKPLPVTDGIKFRGLAGGLRKIMTFTQTLTSLFKYVHSHYTYRTECFRFCVNEEIADIAQSCQVYNIINFNLFHNYFIFI